MKKLCVLSLATAMATAAFAQHSFISPTSETVNKYGFTVQSKNHMYKVENGKRSQMAKETVYDILSCKEGSVFGNEYTENTAWTGSACADAGRPGFGMEYYQHFDDCFYTFNEVRFLGYFNYWNQEEYNWKYCSERGDMDENFEMQKPITFTIGVYEEGEDGLPGKCIMQKDINIIGEKTRIEIGDESSGYTRIYEFKADLGQEIDLEHGFIQINAKDMGDKPSCWFALFTVGGTLTAYQKDIINEEYSGQLSCAFCLYGNGTRNAQKAMQIERFMTPSTTASGKYEKVQVEISNIGVNTIDDAKLELYVDGQLVATEDVNATIEPFDNYKYTFNARVDCSEKHKITVKNVTPGDEKKAYETKDMTVEPPVVGEYPECCVRVPNIINITEVKLGDINNTSEGSTYSDYSDKKTTITVGEKQTLNITIKTNDYQPTLGVFIDWNGDHAFSSNETVKFTTFTADETGGAAEAEITVPDFATLGEHRMRIVALPYYYTPDPATIFYNGEVEDYTIIVKPSSGTPVATIDRAIIEQQMTDNTASTGVNLNNTGEGTLKANISYDYLLPGFPSINTSKNAPKSGFKGIFKTAKRTAGRQMEPEKDANTQYVLKYDNGQYDCIGIGNAPSAIFANMYPGALLSNLEGMTISSVDVYIGTTPKNASIMIYGQKKQTECGDIITEQSFTPAEYSWNHVVLDKPVVIGSTDLWIGVKMDEINANGYYIGVDEGPASIGFGDVVNIGGSTWWSMADLGLKYNYCIRANVTGNRTPAISWLNIDKETVEVAPESTRNVTVSFAPQNLNDGVYEAFIEITSNDPLNRYTKIPVYMIMGKTSSISFSKNGKSGIMFNGNMLTVKTEKTIGGIRICDLNGRTVMNGHYGSNEATADLSTLGKGIYIVTVNHTDGTSVSIKIPVLK